MNESAYQFTFANESGTNKSAAHFTLANESGTNRSASQFTFATESAAKERWACCEPVREKLRNEEVIH